MKLLSRSKKLAVVETDNTILITDNVRERKDFIIVLNKPAPKSRLYNIIINKKRYVGYKISFVNDVKNEIAQELIRKQIVFQIVRALVKKKFDFMTFLFGASVGFVVSNIFTTLQQTQQQQQPQPQLEIPNPFTPLYYIIAVIGILGIAAYVIVNLIKTKEWW